MDQSIIEIFCSCVMWMLLHSSDARLGCTCYTWQIFLCVKRISIRRCGNKVSMATCWPQCFVNSDSWSRITPGTWLTLSFLGICITTRSPPPVLTASSDAHTTLISLSFSLKVKHFQFQSKISWTAKKHKHTYTQRLGEVKMISAFISHFYPQL